MIRIYSVGGMMCAACSASVERVTRRLPFIESAQVNLITKRLTVRFDEAGTSPETADELIKDAVTKAGFTCEPGAQDKKEDKKKSEQTRQKQKSRLIGCLIFCVPLFYIAMGPMLSLPVPFYSTSPVYYALLQAVLVLPILLFACNVLISGYKAIFRLHPNMYSLVSLGVTASLLYSTVSFVQLVRGDGSAVMRLYLDSAGMILTLISLGKYFESRCMHETSRAIEELSALSPDKALTERKDGSVREIPAEELLPGDTVIVRPLGRIPADGTLLSEEGSADESMLTGESLPAEKKAGDTVIGGSLNGAMEMRFTVTKTGDASLLGQMVHMVEEAQGEKAPIARIADTISAYFVPAVFICAVISGGITLASKGFSDAFNAFVSVLVIACPCALGLATPTAIMVGTGEAAKEGILFASGAALEQCRKTDTVVFDKTGTVTLSRPVISDIVSLSLPENEFLRLFASGEQLSDHLLSAMMLEAAHEKGISLLPAANGVTRAGFGAEADVDGKHLLMGSARMLREAGIDIPSRALPAEDDGCTLMYLAADGECLGYISAEDPVSPAAADTVRQLQDRGITCHLLTGDRPGAAAKAAWQAGITHVKAQALPEDKTAYISMLRKQGHTVAMIGDGVNDGAALVTADTGYAMGTGTDVAAASADVILMGGRLALLPRSLVISEKTMRVIRQNLFWALFYNTVGIPLAALGMLSPILGAACMSFSSVSVLSNALRLRRILRKDD